MNLLVIKLFKFGINGVLMNRILLVLWYDMYMQVVDHLAGLNALLYGNCC